jgi:HD-GYP domain-containing protein (c-di-GMP phosphodiesterase class II)
MAGRREESAGAWSSGGMRVRRYVPWAVLATASIVVLPAVLVTVIVPVGGLAWMGVSAVSAAVLSLALASVEAALWKRWRGSRDFLFADLMLWGCARRWWTERRLGSVRDSYEAAVEVGGAVRIELLEGLSRLLAARSAHTHGHGRRVARHAERIARAMRLPAAEIARIRTAAAVHDLGKIYIPREILDKPGPLTDEEFEVVKLHSADGADMLTPVGDAQLAAIVRHHHERFDGSGYPDGLVGEEIPLGARIVAVADTFDAVTSSRPYRRANSHKKGLEILGSEAGSQLDGQAVAAFIERYSARRSVASLSFLSAVSARALTALGLTSGGLSVSGASLAQLAPALGAAGLLAVAPGIHHQQSPVTEHNRPPALARFDGRSPVARVGARTRRSSQAGAMRRSPLRYRAHPKPALRSPIASHSTDRRARTQSISTPTHGTSTGRQLTGSPPPPNTSSPPPEQPAPPPTTTPAPETLPTPPKETPTLPVNLPVTVPEVSLPSVKASVAPTTGSSISAEL